MESPNTSSESAVFSSTPSASARLQISKDLLGAWVLESWAQKGPEGIWITGKEESKGLLLITDTGHYSMSLWRDPLNASEEIERNLAKDLYISGRYTVITSEKKLQLHMALSNIVGLRGEMQELVMTEGNTPQATTLAFENRNHEGKAVSRYRWKKSVAHS